MYCLYVCMYACIDPSNRLLLGESFICLFLASFLRRFSFFPRLLITFHENIVKKEPNCIVSISRAGYFRGHIRESCGFFVIHWQPGHTTHKVSFFSRKKRQQISACLKTRISTAKKQELLLLFQLVVPLCPSIKFVRPSVGRSVCLSVCTPARERRRERVEKGRSPLVWKNVATTWRRGFAEINAVRAFVSKEKPAWLRMLWRRKKERWDMIFPLFFTS